MGIGEIQLLLKKCKMCIPVGWMFLSALMIGAAALSVSDLAGKLVNSVMNGAADWNEILPLILIFFGAMPLYGIFKHFSMKRIILCKAELSRRIFHSMLFRKVETAGYKQGNAITNMLEDSGALTQFLEEELPPLFEFLVVAFLMGSATLYMDGVIFLAVLALSFISGISIFMSGKMRRMEEQIYEVKDAANEKVIDLYRVVPILGSIRNGRKLLLEIDAYIDDAAGREVKKETLAVIYRAAAHASGIIREVVVIVYGLAFAGFDVGDVVAMLNITSFFSEIAQTGGSLLMGSAKAAISARRLNATFSSPREEAAPDFSDPKEGAASRDAGSGGSRLELSHVTYLYDGVNGIRDFSAELTRGKINVIVGEMGSGKSTIGKILCGLLHQQSGMISVDGKEVSFGELRYRTAYVDQEAVINFGSIGENVSSFQENCGEDKVRYALERAGLLSWADSLPDGIGTELNAENLNLSGGQKQRLAIARALYKDSDILLLDEPTSALDAENEALVMNTLHQMKDEKIVVVITHDKRMLKAADEGMRIVKMGVT